MKKNNFYFKMFILSKELRKIIYLSNWLIITSKIKFNKSELEIFNYLKQLNQKKIFCLKIFLLIKIIKILVLLKWLSKLYIQ